MNALLFCLTWTFVFGIGFGFGYYIGRLSGVHQEAKHTAELLDSIEMLSLRPGSRKRIFERLRAQRGSA